MTRRRPSTVLSGITCSWCWMGLGSVRLSFHGLKYCIPRQASVRTNQIRSSPFMLRRRTRQGCCLSPFLFDLAIEPLAVAQRIQQDIPGIVRNQVIHKVSLYADDLLLYISNPAESIPKLIDVLHQFGKLSGYRLNFSKSSLFPINQLAISINYNNLPFKLEHQSFTYLGIRVTRQYKDLYDCNFKLLLERTKGFPKMVCTPCYTGRLSKHSKDDNSASILIFISDDPHHINQVLVQSVE